MGTIDFNTSPPYHFSSRSMVGHLKSRKSYTVQAALNPFYWHKNVRNNNVRTDNYIVMFSFVYTWYLNLRPMIFPRVYRFETPFNNLPVTDTKAKLNVKSFKLRYQLQLCCWKRPTFYTDSLVLKELWRYPAPDELNV